MTSATLPLRESASASAARAAEPHPRRAARRDIAYLLISPGGVLYDNTLWWRWLMQMLSRFGMHMHAGMLDSLWQQDYYDDVCCGRREFFDALREFLASCGMRSGQVDELCAAGRAHWKSLELELHTFPQAARTLFELSQYGRPMGLLVYGPLSPDETHAQLDRMGILGHFDHVICSADVAAALPSQTAWGQVLQTLGSPAESVGYVSHSHRLLEPARSAGLQTMAYQCPAAKADAHLSQLSDLPALANYPRQLQVA